MQEPSLTSVHKWQIPSKQLFSYKMLYGSRACKLHLVPLGSVLIYAWMSGSGFDFSQEVFQNAQIIPPGGTPGGLSALSAPCAPCQQHFNAETASSADTFGLRGAMTAPNSRQ